VTPLQKLNAMTEEVYNSDSEPSSDDEFNKTMVPMDQDDD